MLSLSLFQPGSRGFNYCGNAIDGAKGNLHNRVGHPDGGLCVVHTCDTKSSCAKKISGVGMGSPIPLKDKEEVPLTFLVSPFLVLT